MISCAIILPQNIYLTRLLKGLKYTVSEKDCTLFFIFFFLGAQCVESGVSCTDCY